MPYATRDGVRLYYEIEGSGDPALVFIHGWCCDHTFFQPQFDHFKTSHTVVTMDLRGCGQSDRPEDGYDIPTLADDVAALCCEIGLTRPVVVGHSLGGMIAIELAARHPSLPGAVIAVDPAPIEQAPEVRGMLEGFTAQLASSDGDAARRSFIESLFLSTDDPNRKQAVIDTMCSVPLRIATATVHGVTTWKGRDALERCEAPLLVLLSRPDSVNDPAQLLALKPDVHIGVTVGAGHLHQLEVPEQVNPMIERFLRVAVTNGNLIRSSSHHGTKLQRHR